MSEKTYQSTDGHQPAHQANQAQAASQVYDRPYYTNDPAKKREEVDNTPYEKNLKTLKRLLGEYRFTSSKQAIEAYQIFDGLSPKLKSRFEQEHPDKFTKMLDNLPAEFIDNLQSGFEKGISSKSSEKDKPSGVDRMLEMLKNQQNRSTQQLQDTSKNVTGSMKAIEINSFTESIWQNSRNLELVLSILAQNEATGIKAAEVLSNARVLIHWSNSYA